MSDKKNIERLFQERFKDFEAIPSSKNWGNIAAQLEKKEKKKRIIPFWLKATGIAASLLLGFVVVDMYTNDLNTNFNPTVSKPSVVAKDNNNETSKSQVTELEDKKKNVQNDHRLVNQKSDVLVSTNSNQNKSTDSNSNSQISSKNNLQSGIVSSNNDSDKKTITYNVKSKATKNHNHHVTSKNAIVANEGKVKVRYDTISIANRESEKSSQIKNTSIVQNNSKGNQNTTQVNNRYNRNNSSKLKQENNPIVQTNSVEKQNNNDVDNDSKSKTIVDGNAKTKRNTTEKNDDGNRFIKEVNKSLVFNSDKQIIPVDSIAVAKTAENPLDKILKENKEKEKQEDKAIVQKTSKLKVRPNAAPIYMNSSQGSPIANQFVNNRKNYETSLSVGIGLDYAVSKKIGIRTGVNKFDLGYNTNDIAYYANLNARNGNNETLFETIKLKPNARNMVIESKIASPVNTDFDAQSKNEGYINQRFSYLEVPVEVSYKLVDNKFGIQVFTGVSTLFLNDNKVSLVASGLTTEIGEANNLNKIHFSTNIGVGFKYSFWKSFEANFEPTLKYQINTFNANSGGFKPYFVGLYTGISFKF